MGQKQHPAEQGQKTTQPCECHLKSESKSNGEGGKQCQQGQESQQENLEFGVNEKMRRHAGWIVLYATTTWGIFSALFIGYHSIWSTWVRQILEEHFAALVGIPMAALMAMCVVLLLRFTAGFIELQTPFGFEFKGAAGQIVFWIACFLAVVAALEILW